MVKCMPRCFMNPHHPSCKHLYDGVVSKQDGALLVDHTYNRKSMEFQKELSSAALYTGGFGGILNHKTNKLYRTTAPALSDEEMRDFVNVPYSMNHQLAGLEFNQVSVGPVRICALSTDKRVRCWGKLETHPLSLQCKRDMATENPVPPIHVPERPDAFWRPDSNFMRIGGIVRVARFYQHEFPGELPELADDLRKDRTLIKQNTSLFTTLAQWKGSTGNAVRDLRCAMKHSGWRGKCKENQKLVCNDRVELDSMSLTPSLRPLSPLPDGNRRRYFTNLGQGNLEGVGGECSFRHATYVERIAYPAANWWSGPGCAGDDLMRWREDKSSVDIAKVPVSGCLKKQTELQQKARTWEDRQVASLASDTIVSPMLSCHNTISFKDINIRINKIEKSVPDKDICSSQPTTSMIEPYSESFAVTADLVTIGNTVMKALHYPSNIAKFMRDISVPANQSNSATSAMYKATTAYRSTAVLCDSCLKPQKKIPFQVPQMMQGLWGVKNCHHSCKTCLPGDSRPTACTSCPGSPVDFGSRCTDARPCHHTVLDSKRRAGTCSKEFCLFCTARECCDEHHKHFVIDADAMAGVCVRHTDDCTALCTKSGSTGKHVCSKGCNHLVSEPSTPDNQQMAVCQAEKVVACESRTHLNPYSSNIDSDIALIRPVALTAYQKCDTQKKVQCRASCKRLNEAEAATISGVGATCIINMLLYPACFRKDFLNNAVSANGVQCTEVLDGCAKTNGAAGSWWRNSVLVAQRCRLPTKEAPCEAAQNCEGIAISF